ncbi:esterase/lipase family protein [Piscibacillus halophilus]|uniref:PGAP1-like protein n=1 Tax=Piscibacillus halophilus TaxID=571933 RepID=A0A1H9DNK2_9BACI|nr:hypothetical protein [Piscibacillus halophilus]SEQ15086.1 PGAP1-like protein [Piscibacillus halophilus]
MYRKLSLLTLLVFFIFGSALTSAESKELETPKLVQQETDEISITGKIGNGNEETPGEWYTGTTPSNLDPNKPILLFVHGLNSTAQTWWEDNDMYQTAYDAGYQTTFLQLHDAGGYNEDMWENGQLLAEKIIEISDHFNGKPITIVAHSKGGVDSQAALTYYGAHQYVDNVITLSSPHHGSQLADLAYSSWASWLADVIGTKGDGTYSLQMAEMEDFRSQTDAQPLAYHNDYYTFAGTSWGSVFSSTWYGGMYLSQYGSNDGAVTVDSSRLPGGTEVAVGDWDHSSIRTGTTFSIFENHLAGTHTFNTQKQPKDQKNNKRIMNQWVHGGQLAEGQDTITITVEDGVSELHINLMTAHEPQSMKLVAPDGSEYPTEFKSIELNDGVFKGAISHVTDLKNPEPGEWTLKIYSEQEDSYLIFNDFKTTQKINLNKHIKRNGDLNLTYNMQSQHNIQKATYTITESNHASNKMTFTNNSNHERHIKLTKPNTVYNVTIDIEGTTNEGYPFKRTVVESVKVPGKSNR